MSGDTLERTAGGATKGLFAALGFILLMVGVELMVDKTASQIGLATLLVILGACCFFLAYAWETAKKILTPETQRAIEGFAKHHNTWRGILGLILLTVILCPFIEQHRWPFSYPADPQLSAENIRLKDQIRQDASDLATAIGKKTSAVATEKELADKWRFSSVLRRGGTCGYQMRMTSKASSTGGFWSELLQYGGWNERAGGVALAPAPGSVSSGITIRVKGETGVSTQCAGDLQRALSDIYPNPASRVVTNQQSDFLSACPDCVQIEIDY